MNFFSLTRRQVEILLEIIGPGLQPKAYTNHALSPAQKICIALRFYACNECYYTIGNVQGLYVC
jgi:hypothetical protein